MNSRVPSYTVGWMGAGASAWNMEQVILIWRIFMSQWRPGCVETDELHLELTLQTPKINCVQRSSR